MHLWLQCLLLCTVAVCSRWLYIRYRWIGLLHGCGSPSPVGMCICAGVYKVVLPLRHVLHVSVHVSGVSLPVELRSIIAYLCQGHTKFTHLHSAHPYSSVPAWGWRSLESLNPCFSHGKHSILASHKTLLYMYVSILMDAPGVCCYALHLWCQMCSLSGCKFFALLRTRVLHFCAGEILCLIAFQPNLYQSFEIQVLLRSTQKYIPCSLINLASLLRWLSQPSIWFDACILLLVS